MNSHEKEEIECLLSFASEKLLLNVYAGICDFKLYGGKQCGINSGDAVYMISTKKNKEFSIFDCCEMNWNLTGTNIQRNVL